MKIQPYEEFESDSIGLFSGVPENVYRNPAYGLSRSTAATMVYRSPAHARYELLNPTKPTIFMQVGTLVHMACLEPKKLKAAYAVKPAENKDGDKWHGNKTWCKEWLEKHSLKIVISQEQEEQILGCVDALKAHTTMSGMLKVGHSEVSVFAEYEGTRVKCRPDLIAEDAQGRLWVLDIKKCQEAHKNALRGQFRSMARHFQEAWYRWVLGLAGVKVDFFVFAAVEESPPHGVAICQIEPKIVEAEMENVHLAVDLWTQCNEQNKWPGYFEGIQTLSWNTYKE